MSDRSSDEDLARLVGELVRSLRDLEREIGPAGSRNRPPLPTPRELRRFTSEIAIPGLVLILETNIRALRLLQRALEFGEGADRASAGADDLRERATAASEATLGRLDDALAELGRAIEGRPGNEEAAELLDEARVLRAEVRSRLADRRDPAEERPRGRADDDTTGIDVDAELESIKDELGASGTDDGKSDAGGRSNDDRSSGGDGSSDDS